MRKLRTFRAGHLERLASPEHARQYLLVALEAFTEDSHSEVFLSALRDVAEAQGGIAKLAEKSQLNRQHLYRALSGNTDPRLSTFGTILQALGYKLSLKRIHA